MLIHSSSNWGKPFNSGEKDFDKFLPTGIHLYKFINPLIHIPLSLVVCSQRRALFSSAADKLNPKLSAETKFNYYKIN